MSYSPFQHQNSITNSQMFGQSQQFQQGQLAQQGYLGQVYGGLSMQGQAMQHEKTSHGSISFMLRHRKSLPPTSVELNLTPAELYSYYRYPIDGIELVRGCTWDVLETLYG